MNGGITIISPDGARIEHVPMPDPLTTNICFGGPDLRTAYITLSAHREARLDAVEDGGAASSRSRAASD